MLSISNKFIVRNNYICHMISFDNTEIAFKSKTNEELSRSYYLFKLMGNNQLVDFGKVLLLGALKVKLPIKWLVKEKVISKNKNLEYKPFFKHKKSTI